MDGNSSKPVETGNAGIEALQKTLEWLKSEGGQSRAVRAISQLAEITLTALRRGDSPPQKDIGSLRDLIGLLEDDPAKEGRAPLRGREIQTWWQAREEQLFQTIRRLGGGLAPRLVVNKGGGRGIQTHLHFEFVSLLQSEGDEGTIPTHSTDPADPSRLVICYQMDPAKPALWLRLLVGQGPFPVRSWRGAVIGAALTLMVAIVALMWIATLAIWLEGWPLSTLTLVQLFTAIGLTAGLYYLAKPLLLLPHHRVTNAGLMFLALSEVYGQLRNMPRQGASGRARDFALVRHWGTCPICSAEVDLEDGGREFPDRLVGRCHDAPLEHVFSFDPVTLVGVILRGEPGSVLRRFTEVLSDVSDSESARY